jgi:hypothetical protein
VFHDTGGELAWIVSAATRGGGERLDISESMMPSMLDSIFMVGFGVSLGVQSGYSE